MFEIQPFNLIDQSYPQKKFLIFVSKLKIIG